MGRFPDEPGGRHQHLGRCPPEWRCAARDGLLLMPDDDALAFLPVSVLAGAGDPPRNQSGTLTLEIGDVRILVPPAFDAPHLARVIGAVRSAP